MRRGGEIPARERRNGREYGEKRGGDAEGEEYHSDFIHSAAEMNQMKVPASMN